MSKILELTEKHNEILRDAQKILLQDTVSAEQRSKTDEMFTAADEIASQIESLKNIETRLAKFDGEKRSNPKPNRENPGTVIQPSEVETPEKRAAMEKRALKNYMLRGIVDQRYLKSEFALPAEVSESPEFRDLATGGTAAAITGGSQFIPQAFFPTLIEAKKMYGNVLNIVSERKTENGAPMKIALSNDTANGMRVIGETTAVVEVDPALTSIISYTDTLTTDCVRVSLQEMQDSAWDIDAFIRNIMGQRYYRGISSQITNGSTTGNIQSLLTSAGLTVATASGTAITYADIVKLYASLDPAYEQNATFTMASSTRNFLLGVTDSFGRPLFNPSPNDGALNTLLSKPVMINQYMPAIPTATGSTVVVMQFGDFAQGYMYRNAQDFSIIRLNERFMDQLEVGFLGYCRAGGISLDAGTHPIANLTMLG